MSFICEKGTFLFLQLCPVMARKWLAIESEFFLGPKIHIFGQKSIFLNRTPIFVNGAFVAIDNSYLQVLDPSKNLFSFPSYGLFSEGTRPMCQKVLPNPTVGLCLSVKSLCLQRTGPSGLRAARAGFDNVYSIFRSIVHTSYIN